ncbi:hypothetical protein BASA83_006741 [Batrachochytrium salamandrivorans]|nr:hypothetical protein BASA83_006741 [Batrachochytrium salamandrivorans]
MLSRLIVTFLCAAAIGSVSGVFLTFDPKPIEFEDIEVPISFSAKLKSKPTEAVTVYFEHPSMSMSTCMIVFNQNNWNVPQEITAILAPLFVGSSNPPKDLPFNSELLARKVTVSSLSADIPTTDTLKVRRRDPPPHTCFIKSDKAETFDKIPFSFNKPGWYNMAFTRDIKVQVFRDKCTAELSCIKKVLARYGSSVVSLDVSGPAKSLREYSVTEVTQNTNGLRYFPGPHGNEHKIIFPYGSEFYLTVVDDGGIMSLGVTMSLGSGYLSSGGFCNKPRDPSPDNKLIGFDGKSYNPKKEDEVDAFAKSWKVRDEDVLTNSGARTLNLPARFGTVCRIPEKPQPNPVIPVPTMTTTTTTTTTTTSSSTVDLSKSTLSPTITYTLSSTTITTSPSTTSTTSPYLPDPPTPGGYVHPPPPSPGGYVVDEIQRCPKPAKI